MLDIIHLLPDSIANQIAAGEVVQRPASVVKELLENSIDARANTIQLIVKDAGRTLIQVIDDGIGMSATDARMSFERHATSKIRTADDLFAIRTMGFRGEALASIAAVAQVELRTRRLVDEVGTAIRIEGSDFKNQESVSCPKGTNFQVKNLFFNVPARRNFLKSNPVEMKHVLDEFQRVALAHPDITFTLYHNDVEVYNLPAGKLSRRIVDIFGKTYREQLATCEEETPFVNVEGYVGKPESAKKGRGEQFFFVNKRYIKHNYLHHAVLSAFEATIPEGSSPFYVLFLEIDPSHIDINIHPTKTEIKFDDERAVYAIIRSAVRRAIGVYNLTPTIDFESDINFGNITSTSRFNDIPTPINPGIADFEKPRQGSDTGSSLPPLKDDASRDKSNTDNWRKLFEGLDSFKPNNQANLDFHNADFPKEEPITLGSKANDITDESKRLAEIKDISAIQIQNRFIVAQAKTGLMLIDQRAAYERILYEKYYNNLKNKNSFTQQLLFPKTLDLSPADFQLVTDIQDEIKALGFSFEEFGQNTIKITGVPPEVQEENEKEIFEGLVQQFKANQNHLQLDSIENVARSFSKKSSAKYIGELSKIEINLLIHQLFETAVPGYTPNGEPTMTILSLEHLADLIIKK
ncbi:DNA mismatch repair endonuclease MutL [Emticicia sp. BO119]|uniref:DNA mismatch repair endonuclease MutL n=1 Tax=Emticicia sp. BO119 TaxID=2757768 RepID=UPI0015F0E649|nr:DNA mismatch repair endonuclease MutL [Emticicia sp. BO119]MBA4853699.1 DNA mismatch repair endonuclease MutL [Emticicia sp. BO119]